MTAPRGIRNRNPGNIVVSGWTQRQSGYQGPEPEGRFARFDTMANGLAALIRLLQSYRSQHGLTTVRGIINRWAPPVENDTGSYALSVAKALGVSPEQELPDEPHTYYSLARAIAAHENGRDAAEAGISDRDYAEAMAAVFGTAPTTATAPTEPTVKEKVMALPGIALAAAQALFPLIVDLFRARGSKTSERNAEIVEAAAPAIMAIARQVVPGRNDQEVAETILADKTLQATFRAQAAMSWSEIEPFLRFEEESRAKARDFTETLTAGDGWRSIGAGVLIGVLSLTIVVGGGAMFWQLMDSPMLDPGQKGLILGALIAAFTTTVGFWFGSSRGSQLKDQALADQAARPRP